VLSSAEIARHHEQGYLIPAYRLPETQLEVLQEALEWVIAANPSVRPEFLISVHIAAGGSEGIAGHAAFLALCRERAVLDIVADLIGPDIVLWACQVFCKRAADGLEIPWHQDRQYWPIRPLATCTVWVALDHSTDESGCLHVLPGYHRERRLRRHRPCTRAGAGLNEELDPAEFDAAAAVDVEIEPGRMPIHDVYMPHGSRPNRSGRRRAGVAIRYMPAPAHFDRTLFPPRAVVPGYQVDLANRPLWLVRGQDRAGNDFITGHGPLAR